MPDAPVRNPRALCNTCPYWAVFREDQKWGMCRFGPPTEHQKTLTMRDEWCGRHPQFFDRAEED